MRLPGLAFGLFWFLNGGHVNGSPVPSNETLLESLVFVSAYIFPNQSALEGAVKDSSWQRYDNVDASSYWSTGKQDMKTTDVSVVTYAYTADNLARRDGDIKKKHHYLGALGAIPAIGGGAAWLIAEKYFKTKPGVQPTGVNVAGPSVPTLLNTPGIGPPNTIPPEILKPGPLENIITSHGTPITPESLPPPTEPLLNGVKPPSVQPAPELNLPPPKQVEPANVQNPVDPGSKLPPPKSLEPVDAPNPVEVEPQGPPPENRPKTPWERVKDKAGRKAEEARRAKEADDRERKQFEDAERQGKEAEQKAKESGQADDAKEAEEAKKAEEVPKAEQAETAKEAQKQADEAKQATDEASKHGVGTNPDDGSKPSNSVDDAANDANTKPPPDGKQDRPIKDFEKPDYKPIDDAANDSNTKPPPDGKQDRPIKDFEKPDYKPKEPEIPKDRWDPSKKPPPGNNPPGDRPLGGKPPANEPPAQTNPFRRPKPAPPKDNPSANEAPKDNPSAGEPPQGEKPTFEQPKPAEQPGSQTHDIVDSKLPGGEQPKLADLPHQGTHDTGQPKPHDGVDASNPGPQTGKGSSSGSKPHHVDAHGKPRLDANGKPVHFDIEFGKCLDRGIDPLACLDKNKGYDQNAMNQREHGFGETVKHSDDYVPPSSDRFERIAGELDGTVDDAVDLAAEGVGKESRGFWGHLKDAGKLTWKGFTELWQKIDDFWKKIMKPFKKAWNAIKKAFKKAWNWIKKIFTGGGKGGSVLAKIGQSFGKFFSHITNSAVWKGIKNSGLGMWLKKWGPKIGAGIGWISAKISRKIFWVFLLLDIKDMISVELCLIKAMEMQSDKDLPSYCDDPYTKLTVGWAVQFMTYWERKHPQ